MSASQTSPAAVPFGATRRGEPVDKYTLHSAGGLSVTIITLGATIANLELPDRHGDVVDCVLGFEDVAGYESASNQYFGCTVGRVCNRIANGRFLLDEKAYSLGIGDGPHHLHGGLEFSFDKVVWSAESFANEFGNGVRCSYVSPDGEEGYPGALSVDVVYFVPTDERQVRISFAARADQPTPINLTNHSYFNLAGAGSPSVLDHLLRVNADRYTPTNDTQIPAGELASVTGTPVDFRQPVRIGDRIESLNDLPSLGYDHNFVLNKPSDTSEMTLAAELRHPSSGRCLRVHTTEPGMQFYSGNHLHGQQGKAGQTYHHRSAVCLETQHFPDSVNHPHFPSTILRPGEKYQSETVFEFSCDNDK